MKKIIGILKGHPIVEGDKNLKSNNEIHISDLNKGGGSPTFTYYLLDRYSGENIINLLARYSTYVRTNANDGTGKRFIELTTYFKTRESNFSWEYIYGVCIDWDTPTWIEGELISRREHISRNADITVEEIDQWLNPVTEEEFYNS